MSSAEFQDLARPLLSTHDREFFDLLDLDPGEKRDEGHEPSGPSYAENAPKSGCDFIDRWREWERTLRLNLARQRAQKIKQEGGGVMVEPPALPTDAVAAVVKAVSATESPFEAELTLDKARWGAIDALQGIDCFARNMVYGYLLKLLLLERHAMFNNENGYAEYKTLYASILGSVQPDSSSAGEIK